MDGVIEPPAAVQQTDEQRLITEARDAQAGIEAGKWIIGKAAHQWCERYANGRTDADFARLTGIDADTVQKYRHVFAIFGDVSDAYPNLKFSHFRVATAWDDAAECLVWANENQASVREMQVWRRMQHGEDLTTEPEHVSDVDPYQKPGTIVVPTPKDERDGRTEREPVCDSNSNGSAAAAEDGRGVAAAGRSIDCRGEHGGPDAARSGAAVDSSNSSNLESVLDTVRSLVDALKPRLSGAEPHTLAEQLRRLADEIERV